MVKFLHKMNKLPHMGLQDPVFAVYDIELPGVFRLVERKQEKLVRFFHIGGRPGGEHGNPKAVGDRFLDALQVVHAGHHV